MKKQVLIVDDNEINRMLLENILKEDYTVLQAANGREALEILENNHESISAMLLDLKMPVMDGYEVLTEMRNHPKLSLLPVIVTTVDEEIDTEVKALEIGANDFALKPYNPDILRRRLWNLINLRETAAIVNAIRTDELTGLYNRSAFFDIAAKRLAEQKAGYYVMACFDVNNFKVINDRYGNLKGDEVLRFLAKTFADGFSECNGICARITGDNFAVLYPKSFMNSQELDNIRRAAAELDGSIPPLTFSIGRYIADDLSLSVSAMFDRAAIAEQSVKGRFDEQIAFYDDSMRIRIMREQEITSEMKSALKSRQFETWLQAQYNHTTGALVGAEALVRWRHPKHGIISPAEFIPIFERNGFIYELDKFVWRRTCELLSEWINEGLCPPPISVNISRYDIIHEDLVDIIVGLTEEFGIPKELLRLEITESAFAKSSERIIYIVSILVKSGFTVEIDDFGSGYSSLNTLKDVPAQIVKLDMRFLEGNDNSDRGGNIIESIIRMTKWLGMAVIAEGVETMEQADFLKSIGCSYIQGYLYAKPIPSEKYAELLRGAEKEEKLISVETVKNLDNNLFWDPNSMDTLIFNRYVGGACIFEWHNNKIEMLRANDKYAKILCGENSTVDDALGIDWDAHMDEENATKTHDAIQRAISSGDEVTFEAEYFNFPRKIGKIYLRTTFRVIAHTNDRYLLYATNENITSEHEALLRLQTVVANINGGVCAVSCNGNGEMYIVFSNDTYYSMLGYTKDMFKSGDVKPSEIVVPEDRQALSEVISSAMKTRENSVHDYHCIKRDGSIIFVRVSTSVIEMAGISDTVLLNVITDITEISKAEQKELQAAEQLRLLNETARVLLTRSDINDGINGVLKKILEYFGGDRAYVIEVDKQNRVFNNTYEICADGIESQRDYLQEVPFEAIPFWLSAFDSSNYSYIENVAELDDSRAEEREILTAQNIHSLIAVALLRDGELIGFVGVDNPERQRSHIEHLQAIGDFLVTTIIRRQLNDKIESDRQNIENLMRDTPGGFARMHIRKNGAISTVYVNESFCRMRKMTRDEILSEDCEDAESTVHPDDLELVRSTISEIMQSGEVRNIKYRLIRSDNEYIYVNVYGRITVDEAGNAYLNAYYTEVDEQVKKTLSVRDTMPFILSTIMKYTTDLTFVKDDNFRYICCSPTFAQFAGKSKESEVIGKTDFDLFENDIAQKFRDDDLKLFIDGEPLVDYIEAIPSDDGTQHYSSTSKYILRDTTGKIIGLYGSGRDVTEYRTAFEQLKLLTDSIPGGLATYACSADEIKLVYFNDGFHNMFGCTRTEYEKEAQNDATGMVFAEDVHIITEQVAELRKNNTMIDCTYRIHDRQTDGHKWINLRGRASEWRGDTVYVNVVLYDITAAKNNEEAAYIHEKEIKLALSKMGRMISEYNVEKRTLELTDVYAGKYGFPLVAYGVPESMQETGGMSDEDFVTYCEFYHAIQRGEKPEPIEIQKKTPDGKTRWERMTAYTIFNEDGKPVRALIAADNTTEQRIRYELERSRPTHGEDNMLFHALFDLTSGDTLEYFDRNEKPVPDNERLYTINGENVNKDLFADDNEYEQICALHNPERLCECFKNGECEFTADYRRRLPDGDIVWVRNILRTTRMPASSNILLFEYCYNIEDEKLSALMFSALVSTSYDYVARINGKTHGFSIITNDSVKYCMPPQRGDDIDIISRSLAEKNVHPDDVETTIYNTSLDGIRKNLADREQFQFICRTVHPDGTIRYKKLTQYYLDKTLEIIILTREDITQIMEEENKKNEVLANALEAANQASRAKTQFLSRMSHELRTPMNAIIGLTALSASEIENSKQIEDNIAKIGMSARYLLSLINDILEMSRIESGRMTLSEAPFDFEQFVSNLNTIIYAQTSAKGVDYDVIINSYLEPTYVGDVTKLQEILVNVLGNAAKFTPAGGKVTLAIEQLRCINKRAMLRFVVNDTGVGIDSKFIPHLFEPFSQESANLTSTSTGTGLGLAITKNLVEMMNGHISVQSVKNVGSVFTIDVQLGVSEQSRQYLELIASMNLSALSALVVDDDVIVCKSTESILRAMGMTAEWVDSGMRAVERVKQLHAEQKDFDTIFIDLKMPDMDGIETTRQIRRIVGNDVTIIIITAYDWHGFENEAREAGVDIFMDKPLFQSSVVKAFEKVFMKNKTRIEVAPPETYDFTGKRFLLVEDNALNIEIARRLLEKNGAEVITAENGLEAMETYTTAEDNYFDLILMDIRMPIMDGLTATKNIRNLRKAGSREIPIVAMTANAFDDDVELSLSSGMDAHLAKPIEPQIMYATIKRLLKK